MQDGSDWTGDGGHERNGQSTLNAIGVLAWADPAKSLSIGDIPLFPPAPLRGYLYGDLLWSIQTRASSRFFWLKTIKMTSCSSCGHSNELELSVTFKLLQPGWMPLPI